MARRGFNLQSEEVTERAAKAEADALEDFQPRQPKQIAASTPPTKKAEGWPSREAKQEHEREPNFQLHIHGPRSVADRFNIMCKNDRRSRWAMLEILMDAYEGKNK